MIAALRELLFGHPVFSRASVYLSLNGQPHFVREGEMLSSRDSLVKHWPAMFTTQKPTRQREVPTWAR